MDRSIAYTVLLAAFFVSCIRLAIADDRPTTSSSGTTARRFPVTDFGAKGDGTTLNTKCIQAAIDEAASAGGGGGTVVIPNGVFLSGAVFLKSGVNLHLDQDGVLKGSTDIEQYPRLMTRIEGHFQEWRPALINAEKCDHLLIDGEGTLDGSGQPFWDLFRKRRSENRETKNLDVDRPRLVFVRESNDVTVRGVHFKDSGFWNLHLYKCTNVLADGLDFVAGPTSPSTDGIDVDSSQHVTIRGCKFNVNDDCIALKGTKGPKALEDQDSPPVEHIRISDCTVTHGGSIVTCGSEATIVRDVVAENCRTEGMEGRGFSVLRLKLRPDTPQTYEDIHLRGITLDKSGSVINVAPWTQYFDLQGQAPPAQTVRNISISDVKGTCTTLGSIKGNEKSSIEDVTIENVDIKTTGPKPQLLGAKNLVLKNVTINGEAFTGE